MAARGSYAKGVAKRKEILTTALEVIAGTGYSRASVRELAAAVGLSQAGLLHYFHSKEELFAEVLRRRDEVDQALFTKPETAETDAPDAGDEAAGDEASGTGADDDPAGAPDDDGADDADAEAVATPDDDGADDTETDIAEPARPAPTVEGYRRLIRRNAGVPGLVQLYVRLSAEATDPDHPAHPYFEERYRVFREAAAAGMRTAQAEGTIDPALDPDLTATLLLALADGLQTQWLMDPGIDMGEHVDAFLRLLEKT